MACLGWCHGWNFTNSVADCIANVGVWNVANSYCLNHQLGFLLDWESWKFFAKTSSWSSHMWGSHKRIVHWLNLASQNLRILRDSGPSSRRIKPTPFGESWIPSNQFTWGFQWGGTPKWRVYKKKNPSGWWFEPLWKIWESIGMIIPNLWENRKWSKPPASHLNGWFGLLRKLLSSCPAPTFHSGVDFIEHRTIPAIPRSLYITYAKNGESTPTLPYHPPLKIPCLHLESLIWSFPEMGVALNHPFLDGIFHFFNQPFGGTPISGHPHLFAGLVNIPSQISSG